MHALTGLCIVTAGRYVGQNAWGREACQGFLSSKYIQKIHKNISAGDNRSDSWTYWGESEVDSLMPNLKVVICLLLLLDFWIFLPLAWSIIRPKTCRAAALF